MLRSVESFAQGTAIALRQASPRLRSCAAGPEGCGRLHSRRKQPGIGGGPPLAADALWNSRGDLPTSSEKRELNDPRLENPTSMHTSVTVRLAERSRSL